MQPRKLPAHRSGRHLATRFSRAGKTTKKVLAISTTALLVASAVVLGVTAPASAHVPDATSTCSTLSVNLTEYTDKVPGTDATYKTVYQRYQWNPKGPKTPPDADSTPLNDPDHWQASTSNYKGEDVNQQIQESNGNGGDNASWSYWTATQVEVTPATPAEANTVTVSINGVQVDSQEFGSTFIKDYPFTNSAVVNDWSVTFIAWDGPSNSQWSRTISGSSEPCVTPPAVIPNSITTSHTQVCGSVTITLRNISPWIYPVTVEVDGEASYGPTVDNRATVDGTKVLNGPQQDASQSRTINFVEDTGTHTVRYRVAAGSESDLYDGLPVGEWTTLTVESDCQQPVAFEKCEGSTALPVSTNLNAQGWISQNGEYVAGGLKLGSPTQDSWVYIDLPTPVTLSELESLSFSATDSPWGGIIAYNDDNTVNVHYEPYYSDPLWTTRTGVLPANAGGQGGGFSGDFSDLQSNPEVTAIAFWVNAGHEAVLHSLTFNCQVQEFGYVAPTLPASAVCVGTGDWYTEADDAAPVATAEGLRFDGGSGKAVGYRVGVTGNLQGWTSTSYDATGTLSKFYYRIVIDPHAGDINGDSVDNGNDHYVSLTVTSGQPVDGSSVAYSNRLGTSKTLDEFAAMWPDNQIASVGFHLDSAASSYDSVLLKKVTSDCGDVNFVSTPPTEVRPIKPVWVDPCGLDNGHWTTTEQEGVSWETESLENGAIRITATAEGDFVLKGKHTWEQMDSGDLCPVVETCNGLSDGGTATNLNASGWSVGDTRSAGHAEYVAGGLHVYTDDNSGNAKVAWNHPLSLPLKSVGQLDVDYTNNQPGWFANGPGLNLFVTFESGKTGTLVYEPVYGQDLWLTGGSNADVKVNAPVIGGGNGSQWHGTLNQWLTKYPNAQVTGFAFALGSGVHADGVLHSVTIGCHVYGFGLALNLPTHALVGTSASMTDTTCTTAGSYTLADIIGVQWWVNDKKVDAGTYRVKNASTVNVEATLINEGDAWENGEDTQTQWTFRFTDPENCLPTLAFTGADSGTLGLLLASGLLLTGGLILGFDRRTRRMVR